MARFVIQYLHNNVLLAPGEFTIGRGLECQLPLDDEQVSRKHAILHVEPERLSIEDLGSRNGVYINGARVEGTAEVRHGDRLNIGKQEIRILEDEEKRDRARMATVGSADQAEALGRALAQEDTKLSTQLPEVAELEALSPREREVLKLLALGHTHKEVARSLNVSAKTVETYRARIADKLQLKTRADLVRHALKTGLLDDI